VGSGSRTRGKQEKALVANVKFVLYIRGLPARPAQG
jgi:hypothetical protein